MADTLNAFDNTESRAPMLVVCFRDDVTIKVDGGALRSPSAGVCITTGCV